MKSQNNEPTITRMNQNEQLSLNAMSKGCHRKEKPTGGEEFS